jgi:hypothetical protein
VLLLTNAYVHAYFKDHRSEAAPWSSKKFSFGRPRPFRPQFYELHRLRDNVRRAILMLRAERQGEFRTGGHGEILDVKNG